MAWNGAFVENLSNELDFIDRARTSAIVVGFEFFDLIRDLFLFEHER